MVSLDEYDGGAWRLPPFDPGKLKRVRGDGVIDADRNGTVTVAFTVRKLGTSATLPGVTGPTKVDVHGRKVLWDPRSGTVRVPSGRVPAGFSYSETLATYPT